MIICILYIVIAIVIRLCYVIFIEDKNCEFLDGVSSALISIAVFIILSSYLNKDEPKAIDVYNGKTKMSITYQDSIPIDTIIIYKEPQVFDWWMLKNK